MKTFDYDISEFNGLPSLRASLDAFERNGIDKHISTSIRDIFLRHGAHERFSLSLMHRHFALQDSERLLHIGDVAMPWKAGSEADDSVLGESTPVQWRFVTQDGVTGLAAYEFAYPSAGSQPSATVDPERDQAFLNEFHDFLSQHDLVRYLGLAPAPAPDRPVDAPVEITRGRCNIVFPGSAPVGPGRRAEVSWVFDRDPLVNRQCVASCQESTVGSHLDWHDEWEDDD